SFWGPGFVLVAWIGQFAAAGEPARRGLLTAMVTVWGVRLAWHITSRSWGEPEDRRYREMGQEHGESFRYRSLVTVFWLQAGLLWAVSLVVQLGQWSPTPTQLGITGWMGAAIWLAGFTFEAVADYQLQRFKSDPGNKGKVMAQGLWRYSRHPNYFGEALAWWGIALVVLPTEQGLWALVSPCLITFLLLKVSGVTMAEKNIGSRRPGYQEYAERTNAFIPWFPREE
ncbi:MAG: DUF1295 domain-containing protein, partial [Desulfohalobiaceae bacterium]